jgi:acetylornithine deacetylase/succinyl-diaminopimelate desuccinylase-like protein
MSAIAPGTPAAQEIAAHVARVWDDEILPVMFDYIRIPCVSEAYDPDWKAHGHIDAAVELVREWCAARQIAGLTIDVLSLAGRSPLLLMEVPAFGAGRQDDTVLLYGHLDKQPEMVGWREGLGPWTPVLDERGRLYGRGGADDGYAAFASLLAIEAAQLAGRSHARLVVLIEASEESGSPDLPAYLHAFADRVGTPSLVLCLDSGCLDDERLWVTTSLRGLAGGVVRVDVLDEGVHSGEASGVVPSSFRVLRQLLDRIEDSATGQVVLPELNVEIPPDRVAQARGTAEDFTIAEHFPFVDGTRPMTDDPVEQLLNRTWRPALSLTGVDGIPSLEQAGNVLRPTTAVMLSIRLPPTCDAVAAQAALGRALVADPPSGARVTFTPTAAGPGWNAPSFAPWLDVALAAASSATFGKPHLTFGEGGTIPFMGMLGEMFPDAQFVITGVLGPGSNAHGPNEFLDVPTAKRVTGVLAHVLDAHAHRPA